MLPKVTTIEGRPVNLREKIGSGGEGDVYEVIGDTTRVAKIWHLEKRGDEQSAKISRMCSINVNLHIRGNPVLAWPETPIWENGSIVGYVMPRVQDHFALYECLTPARSRNKNLPVYEADRPLLASRIANIFAALHVNQCFVGDVNPQNILIRRGSLVPIFIDCDSFQINVPDFPFLSPVVTPEYRAPERTQSDVPIDAAVDVFGLAVIVYQMLLGEHPYSGIDHPSSVQHVPTLAGRIADSRFAHAGGARWRPRTDQVKLAWESLPQPVSNVLAQALDYRQFGRNRPSAQKMSELIKSHQTPLAAIQRRFSDHRSPMLGTYVKSPNLPNLTTRRRTPSTQMSAPPVPQRKRPNPIPAPARNEGGESQKSLWDWLSEHFCCIVVIAFWIGIMIFRNV